MINFLYNDDAEMNFMTENEICKIATVWARLTSSSEDTILTTGEQTQLHGPDKGDQAPSWGLEQLFHHQQGYQQEAEQEEPRLEQLHQEPALVSPHEVHGSVIPMSSLLNADTAVRNVDLEFQRLQYPSQASHNYLKLCSTYNCSEDEPKCSDGHHQHVRHGVRHQRVSQEPRHWGDQGAVRGQGQQGEHYPVSIFVCLDSGLGIAP